MKKLITILILGMLVLASYGQSGVLRGPGGLWIGNTTTLTPVFKIGVTPITTTAAQFNYLNTLTGNVQTNLNSVNADLLDYVTLDSANGTGATNTYVTGKDFNTSLATAMNVGFLRVFDPVYYTTPLDNTTYYYGEYQGAGLSTTAAQHQMIIAVNCTLIGFSLTTRSSAANSNEAGTLSVRINNTTDVTLTNAVTWSVGGAYASNFFRSVALSTNLTAGDKIELKLLTPTWGTDAVGIGMATELYFRNR